MFAAGSARLRGLDRRVDDVPATGQRTLHTQRELRVPNIACRAFYNPMDGVILIVPSAVEGPKVRQGQTGPSGIVIDMGHARPALGSRSALLLYPTVHALPPKGELRGPPPSPRPEHVQMA